MNDDQLKQLMRKYAVAQVLPEGSAAVAMRYKSPGLRSLLRRFGKVSVFAAIVAALFFTAKKCGLSISILKIHLIAIGIIAGGALAVSAGAAYMIIGRPSVVSRDASFSDLLPPFPRLSNDRTVPPVAAARYAIVPFRYDEASYAVARALQQNIEDEIRSGGGAGSIVLLGSDSAARGNVSRIYGSVIRTHAGFSASVRIVNGDAEVVFFETYHLNSEREISDVTEKIRNILAK
jgi:hypothetical protein